MLSRFVIEQASFNFMAVFAVCSDFWSPRKRSLLLFLLFPHLFTLKRWDWMVMIFIFWMLSFKSAFSLSSFTSFKSLFSSSLLFAIRVVSSAYLRLLISLPAISIPTWASSSPAFLVMYSAHKLNRQGDNIQPWRTPFPVWSQSAVSYAVLTVAPWPAYRFLRKQIRWSGIPSLKEFSRLLWSIQLKALAWSMKQK